jgi:hypothetical protein
MMSPPKQDKAALRRIAVLSNSDPRSCAKVIAGQRVRGDAGFRIRAALELLGIEVPAPKTEPTS